MFWRETGHVLAPNGYVCHKEEYCKVSHAEVAIVFIHHNTFMMVSELKKKKKEEIFQCFCKVSFLFCQR